MSPNVEELVSQAHEAWELFELEQAAELFEAAAVAEKHAAATRGPFALADQSFSFRLRAAVCRWDLGRFDEARQILRESLTFDWKAARLWSDRHVGEMALCRFLMEKTAAGDHEGFIELWRAATARGEELVCRFTSPYRIKSN
jgi:tetratricopeptide (TPR) repeat protein